MFLDSGKCFDSGKGIWILEVFLDSRMCFGFWEVVLDSGMCFGFWEVFWNLGSVLSLSATIIIFSFCFKIS